MNALEMGIARIASIPRLERAPHSCSAFVVLKDGFYVPFCELDGQLVLQPRWKECCWYLECIDSGTSRTEHTGAHLVWIAWNLPGGQIAHQRGRRYLARRRAFSVNPTINQSI